MIRIVMVTLIVMVLVFPEVKVYTPLPCEYPHPVPFAGCLSRVIDLLRVPLGLPFRVYQGHIGFADVGSGFKVKVCPLEISVLVSESLLNRDQASRIRIFGLRFTLRGGRGGLWNCKRGVGSEFRV